MVLNLISTNVTLSDSRVQIDLYLIGSAIRGRLLPLDVSSVRNTPSRLRVILNAVFLIICSSLIDCYIYLHDDLKCSVFSVLSLKLASSKKHSAKDMMCLKPSCVHFFYMTLEKQYSHRLQQPSFSI